MAAICPNLMFTMNNVLLFSVFILQFKHLSCFSGQNEPYFKDLPVPLLQRHVQISRHLPVCILYRNKGDGYLLEHKLAELWEHRDRTQNYSSWQLGSFSVNTGISSPIRLPLTVPTLRCYLGSVSYFDYQGKYSISSLKHWFAKLVLQYDNQIEEASFDSIDHATSNNELTVVAFSGHDKHYDIEDMLMKIKARWKALAILFVHPSSPDVRKLQDRFKVTGHPFLVFIENSVKTDNMPAVVKELSAGEVTRNSINNYMMMRTMPIITLNNDNFEDIIMKKTKFYVPTLVLFVLKSVSPKMSAYLNAFSRTIDEFIDLELNMKYAVFEVSSVSRKIVEEYVERVGTTPPPFTVLFQAKWKKTTVVGIDQTMISERPTPSTVVRSLQQHGFSLKTSSGVLVYYSPWGKTDPAQISETFEGPSGSMCSWHSSNETDNMPYVKPAPPRKIVRVKKTVNLTMAEDTTPLQPEASLWHQKFGTELVEAKLEKIGKIPVVTSDTWQEVIEKSHAPRHPFNSGGKWTGEVTKVTLVVFIIADCSSCRRNMDLFQQLHTSVSYVDGGALYLMNCTSHRDTCQQLHVTGFPTLTVFRGLGWMESEGCFSTNAAMNSRFMRMDYHGVMMEKYIMDWFSKAASAAVKNAKFEDLMSNTLERSVRLVATVLPKDSRYLPRMPFKNLDYFYPYRCFRLACERLYSQSECYVKYSDKVPRSQYNNDDDVDMVLTQVELMRRDGMQAIVSELGRSLINTLNAEAESSKHSFHKPHRYNVGPGQKCEDDHGFCTDLLVNFTRDHGRLPVTLMTAEAFHTRNSIIFHDGLPVIVALVYEDNVTESSEFFKSLVGAGEELYNEMVVVAVDVDQYPAWAGQFVPRKQRMDMLEDESLASFYTYPRLCFLEWSDHRHASFYPQLDVALADRHNFHFTKSGIVKYARQFLTDPRMVMVETEHF